MKKLERVNQVEKAVIRFYMANRDFTAFCKVLKMLGIVTRNEIYKVIKKHYSDKYFTKNEFKIFCFGTKSVFIIKILQIPYYSYFIERAGCI